MRFKNYYVAGSSIPTVEKKSKKDSTKLDLDLVIELSKEMTSDQKFLFLSAFNSLKKNTGVALTLCLLFGHSGVHNYYLGFTATGIFGTLFFWTGIPTLLAILDLFSLKSRIRKINNELAVDLSNKIKGEY